MPFFRCRRTRVRAGSALPALQDVQEQTKKSRRWSLREIMKWPEAVEREILDLKRSSIAASENSTTPISVTDETRVDHPLRDVETLEPQAKSQPGDREDSAARRSTTGDDVEDTGETNETEKELPVEEHEVTAAFHGAFYVPQSSTALDDLDASADYKNTQIEILGNLAGQAIVPMPELRMRGLYAGSVGLEYFEHIQAEARAAALSSDDAGAGQGPENLDDLELLSRAPDSFGLSPIDSQHVVDRLVELSKYYQEQEPSHGPGEGAVCGQDLDQSTDVLFTKVLLPPSDTTESSGPASRSRVIQALVHTLGTSGPWYDLSIEANRILIGQVLLGQGYHDEVNYFATDELPTLTGRDVVLLQLLLACELYVHVKPPRKHDDNSDPAQSAILAFEEDITFPSEASRVKIKWDLVMAHVFLENVQPLPKVKKVQKPSTLDRAKRLFFPASFATPAEVIYEEKPDLILMPRHQERQIDGLKQFSRSIGWPEMEDLEQTLAQKFSPLSQNRLSYGSSRRSSVYATPSSNSKSYYAQEATDYFTSRASPSPEKQKGRSPMRPQISRGRRSNVSFQLSSATPLDTPSPWPEEQPASPTALHQVVGWLTCTYLTGLILPGESLQHLLVSCMLENSPEAMINLGETATLLGGFVYGRRSYWSSQCIVGRVLAGMRSSSQGWGWIGTNCVPSMASSIGGSSRTSREGWIDIVVDDVDHEIAQDLELSQDLQVHEPADIYDEYLVPLDSPRKPSSLLWFEGLHLTRDSEEITSMEEPDSGPATCTAALNFSSASLSSEIGSARFHLKYDVYFISATPCQPPSIKALLRLKLITPAEGATDRECGAHPLHRSLRYGTVSTVEVVKRDFATPEAGHTLILDARGSETLELLARAWCASVGRHAIVGSESDTCVACCVRKAKYAGISIVIRI